MKTLLIVGIGIGVAIIAALAYYFSSRKSKAVYTQPPAPEVAYTKSPESKEGSGFVDEFAIIWKSDVPMKPDEVKKIIAGKITWKPTVTSEDHMAWFTSGKKPINVLDYGFFELTPFTERADKIAANIGSELSYKAKRLVPL